MKKNILLILGLLIHCTALPQSSSLLEKYRLQALQYNHDLKAAEKNISASLELEKAARSDQKPEIGAKAHFQYTGNPNELSATIPTIDQNIYLQGQHTQYGATLSLMQPLYTGKRILENIRLARHQQSLATYEALVIRAAVCYQTDLQYWNIVARQEMVQVYQDFHQTMRLLVESIQEQVDAGLTDPQDLLMAEVKLNEAQYQLLTAQSNYETGRMAFNSLIGLPLQTPTEVETILPPIVLPDSCLQHLHPNRPEIEIAHEQIKIAENRLNLNESTYKPQLSIGIDANYSSPGYNFQEGPDPNYIAYAKLSIPIFEWGKRRHEKQMALAEIGKATDQLNKITDQIELETRTAQVALSQAIEAVKLCASSLEKARTNEQKARERYHEGENSILEVIDAQSYYQTARLNYIKAKITAHYRYADLLKAFHLYDFI